MRDGEREGREVAFPFSAQTVGPTRGSELQDVPTPPRAPSVPRSHTHAREERIDPAHFTQGHARTNRQRRAAGLFRILK